MVGVSLQGGIQKCLNTGLRVQFSDTGSQWPGLGMSYHVDFLIDTRRRARHR